MLFFKVSRWLYYQLYHFTFFFREALTGPRSVVIPVPIGLLLAIAQTHEWNGNGATQTCVLLREQSGSTLTRNVDSCCSRFIFLTKHRKFSRRPKYPKRLKMFQIFESTAHLEEQCSSDHFTF